MKSWAATALALICSASASADVLFGAEIKGVIYEDGAAAVKVQCKAKDGARIHSEMGDTAVDPAIALEAGPDCPLQALLGSVGCWDPPLERDLSAVVVQRKNGAASHLQVLGHQVRNAVEGPIPIQLEYSATFRPDPDTGDLAPPLTRLEGRLIVPPRPDEPRFFVGEFKAAKLPAAKPGVPFFGELFCNRLGTPPE
jgi:hypothetical protein